MEQVLTGRTPFLSPNQQCQELWHKLNAPTSTRKNHPLDLVLFWSTKWHTTDSTSFIPVHWHQYPHQQTHLEVEAWCSAAAEQVEWEAQLVSDDRIPAYFDITVHTNASTNILTYPTVATCCGCYYYYHWRILLEQFYMPLLMATSTLRLGRRC